MLVTKKKVLFEIDNILAKIIISGKKRVV